MRRDETTEEEGEEEAKVLGGGGRKRTLLHPASGVICPGDGKGGCTAIDNRRAA